MTNLDFSPLYRSTVGFDGLTKLLENASRISANQNNYPPYNIVSSGENHYTISLAIAGFSQDELDIQVENGLLRIAGKHEESQQDGLRYLHRGIANRSFERKFQLAEHVEVTGAKLENGLLNIDLVREIPEAMKPRRIEISSDDISAENQTSAQLTAA